MLRARLTALELAEANVARLGDGLRVETPASADAEGDLSAIGAVGPPRVSGQLGQRRARRCGD